MKTGTRIHLTLHNSLVDSTITFFGLQKRPSIVLDSVVLKPGEAHRIRFINIAPAGEIFVRMVKDSIAEPIKYMAKDGTDLPPRQQIMINESQRFGVGETADFEFKPLKPGTYTLKFLYAEEFGWTQKWVVTVR